VRESTTPGTGERGDPRPPFRSIGIVGLGLIGGSLALSARRAWRGLRVSGVDRGAALDAARLLPAFDATGADLRLLGDVDLVVLAAPVRQNIALLPEVQRHVDSGTVVTDVGSTKRAMVDAARACNGLTFVGGHPLAGAARGGLALARADLFAERPWILTPDGDAQADAVRRLTAFVQGLEASVHVLTAEAHDRLLAYLSHLPQLTASALMATVGAAAGEAIGLAGPGLADTTRLASSPAAIWQDICATNADDIRPALDALIATLQALRDDLEDADAIARFFESAQVWKQRLPRRAE
jgi:prephenate dehydrogenase